MEIPRDRETKLHKGYAFIEFEDREDCVHAIYNMHEAEVFGKIIKVQKARKMAGPRNKAIWDDKEYQKKHGINEGDRHLMHRQAMDNDALAKNREAQGAGGAKAEEVLNAAIQKSEEAAGKEEGGGEGGDEPNMTD